MRCMLEAAVALPVPCHIGQRVLADRPRGRTPQFATVFVTNVDHLTRSIGDWVVRPGCELVLAAVDRPRIASTIDRHLEAEGGICDDVDPGGRGLLPFAEDRHIFPSVGREAAEAVEKLELRSRWSSLRHATRRRASPQWNGSGLRFRRMLELFREAPATAEQYRSCCGLEQATHLGRHQVGA